MGNRCRVGDRSARERLRRRAPVGSSAPGASPCLCRHRPVLSLPRGATGSGSRAGKAPSEVGAKPPARLEIAPRPPGAPPPARAPPHGGKRRSRWQGRDGGNLFPDRSVLSGAHGRHAHARSAAPAAPLAARSVGRGRAAAGGGAVLARVAPSSGIPENWTLICRLAPLRSFLAATAPVVTLSNPALTWGKRKGASR